MDEVQRREAELFESRGPCRFGQMHRFQRQPATICLEHELIQAHRAEKTSLSSSMDEGAHRVRQFRMVGQCPQEGVAVEKQSHGGADRYRLPIPRTSVPLPSSAARSLRRKRFFDRLRERRESLSRSSAPSGRPACAGACAGAERASPPAAGPGAMTTSSPCSTRPTISARRARNSLIVTNSGGARGVSLGNAAPVMTPAPCRFSLSGSFRAGTLTRLRQTYKVCT